MTHLVHYLGFLTYEAVRREWKNTVLIVTVGLVNGIGWALCQNWEWAKGIWGSGALNSGDAGNPRAGSAWASPTAWRTTSSTARWTTRSESPWNRGTRSPAEREWLLVYFGLTGLLWYLLGPHMGGWKNLYCGTALLIGVAYVARYWRAPAEDAHDTLERLGLYLGLLTGLGLSLRNGLKGWFNIYRGNEDYWSRRLWEYLGPVYLACLAAILLWVLFRRRAGFERPVGISLFARLRDDVDRADCAEHDRPARHRAAHPLERNGVQPVLRAPVPHHRGDRLPLPHGWSDFSA